MATTIENKHINLTVGVFLGLLVFIVGGVWKSASSYTEIKNDIKIVMDNTTQTNANMIPLTELTLNIGGTVVLLADRGGIPVSWSVGNVFKN